MQATIYTIESVTKLVNDASTTAHWLVKKHYRQRLVKIELAVLELNSLQSFEDYWKQYEQEEEGSFDPERKSHQRMRRNWTSARCGEVEAIIAVAASIQTNFGYAGAMGWGHVR